MTAGAQPGSGSRRQQLAAARSAVIAEIRACGIPELAGFRRPPTLAELAGALPGPVVVINVSEYRSDALILAGRKLRVLKCPGLTPAALRGYLARFDKALAGLAAAASDAAADAAWPELEDAFHGTARWLWDVLAQHVLAQLGLTGNPGTTAGAGDLREAPRIWWVPTGELARFPLHAAGYHGSPDSATRSVSNRVVSSYATSLTSLRQAITSDAPEHPPDGAVPGTLAVAMPHTPALGPAGDLASAMAEMQVVSRHFPMAVTLAGAGATRAATLAAITNASIAHFGCHATVVPADPSRGRLLVHDGTIPITELQALPAWRRGLAFLSACDTASARGDIPDEFVHLASAFQVIGFEHVVGTAWQVPDDITLAVAEGFYAGVWDPEAGRNADPAAALHASVAAVLATDPLNPFPWAYVHYGADSTALLPVWFQRGVNRWPANMHAVTAAGVAGPRVCGSSRRTVFRLPHRSVRFGHWRSSGSTANHSCYPGRRPCGARGTPASPALKFLPEHGPPPLSASRQPRWKIRVNDRTADGGRKPASLL
jgi:hypothetical protein